MAKNYDRPEEHDIEDDEIVRRAFTCDEVKAIDEDKRLIDFIISTDRVDRMGDIIEVAGWQLKEFRKNPVVLFGHNSRIPPIGKAIKVSKADGALSATAQFMDRDLSEFADSVYRMYLEGYMKAVSVGFRSLQREAIEDDDGHFMGIRFIKQELMEFSAVPIPANPDALINARSAGIDTRPFRRWAEEILDNWGNEEDALLLDIYGLNKTKVRNIYKDAAEPKSSRQDKQEDTTQRATNEVGDMLENLKTVSKSIYKKVVPLEMETIDDGKKKQTNFLDVREYTSITWDVVKDWDNIELIEDKDSPHVKITASNGEVEFEIVGKKDDDIIGKLVSSTVGKDEDEEEEETEQETESSEEEEVTASENESSENTQETGSKETTENEGEEEELEMTLELFEGILESFEEFLDTKDANSYKYTKQDLRKIKFISLFLDELTERMKDLCGLSTQEEEAHKENVKSNGHDKGKQFVKLSDVERIFEERLQDKVDKLVDKGISKARGRLD